MFTAVVDHITEVASLSVDDLADAEVRAALGACSVLQGRVDVLRAKLLVSVHERGLWRRDGARSLAAWLAQNTALSARDARRAADTAALIAADGPVADAVRSGAITPTHVEVINSFTAAEAVAAAAVAAACDNTAGESTAGANAGDDDAGSSPVPVPVLDAETLLGIAKALSPEEFAKAARTARAAADPGGEASRYAFLRALRSLRTWSDADGMFNLYAKLDPVSGAFVERALAETVDALWRAEHPDRAPSAAPRDSFERRRADALIELCRRFVSGEQSVTPSSGPSGVEVLVVIDYQSLLGDLDDHGIATLADGTPIPAGVARRLACEHGIIPVVFGGDSVPLDMGSKRRFATAAQRLMLQLRSPTCEFAGCTMPAHACRAHHLDPWARSQVTDYAGLAWACHTHHGYIHNDGWQLRAGPDNTIETYRPDGTRYHPPRATGPTESEPPEPPSAEQPIDAPPIGDPPIAEQPAADAPTAEPTAADAPTAEPTAADLPTPEPTAADLPTPEQPEVKPIGAEPSTDERPAVEQPAVQRAHEPPRRDAA